MRNMSFALTTEQIRNRTKTVTRRVGWRFLKPGDRIQAVVKCQGLKKGEKIEPLAILRIVSVRREPLTRVSSQTAYGWNEVAREGFAGHPQFGAPETFVDMFCDTHDCEPYVDVTRIEFEYVDQEECEARIKAGAAA